METNFDYSKTYYKVMNEKECHNGYQYHDGLNVLNDEFDNNPIHSCVSGRLYFTDYEHLPKFFKYGIYIREVKIPKDAKVVKDGNDKWGADRIILGKKYHIINDFNKWFKKNKYNYKEYSNYLAEHFSEYFDIWFNKKLYNYTYYSWALAAYCSEYFDKWFDKKLYNYSDHSGSLAKYCSKHFNKWFVKEKYNYKDYSGELAMNCHQYFSIWFDKDLYNYEDRSDYLAMYCSEYFDQWFDEEKYNFKEGGKELITHCGKYLGKWLVKKHTKNTEDLVINITLNYGNQI